MQQVLRTILDCQKDIGNRTEVSGSIITGMVHIKYRNGYC